MDTPFGFNSRWVACHVAMGREPKPWEFIVWLRSQWIEFYRLDPEFRGEKSYLLAHGVEATDREFDAWLRERFPLTDVASFLACYPDPVSTQGALGL